MIRAVPIFERKRIVVADDLDELGHVNNVIWVQFVVELATAHSEAAGLDSRTYHEIGGLWVVRRHELDYRQAALPGEEIVERSWVAESRGARSLRRATFDRASDGVRLVEATTLWAFVDALTQRPRRIPPEVSSAFPIPESPLD